MSAPKPITEHLADLLRERSARGLEKYGTSIDRGDLTRSEWLQHLLEELLDAAQYVEAAKRQALASAPSIPDGWALVPWTPLPSMLVAVGSMNGYAGAHGEADVDHIEWYEAMVAEAQTKLPAEAGAHSPNSVSSEELDPLLRECLAKAIGEAIHNAASKALEQAATQMLADPKLQARQQAFPSGRGYTVERHGNGWAIYLGRDKQHHGANLGQLTECGPELAAQIQAALNAPQPQPQPQPVVEPVLPTITAEEAREFQRWKGMDGATAYHLIERHADGWADVGVMMNAWLEANAAKPPAEPEKNCWTCKHASKDAGAAPCNGCGVAEAWDKWEPAAPTQGHGPGVAP